MSGRTIENKTTLNTYLSSGFLLSFCVVLKQKDALNTLWFHDAMNRNRQNNFQRGLLGQAAVLFPGA